MAKPHTPLLDSKYRAIGKLIGEKIREQRLTREMTQADLCVALGAVNPRISRLENATCRVTMEELYGLAAIFNVSPADLMPTMDEWRQASL